PGARNRMKSSEEILSQEFASIPDAIAAHAGERPDAAALILSDEVMDFGTLFGLMLRVAYSLQRDGIAPQSTIAVCAQTSLNYAVLLLGSVMAGVTIVPLVTTSTPATLSSMVSDAEAKLLFVDDAARAQLAGEEID